MLENELRRLKERNSHIPGGVLGNNYLLTVAASSRKWKGLRPSKVNHLQLRVVQPAEGETDTCARDEHPVSHRRTLRTPTRSGVPHAIHLNGGTFPATEVAVWATPVKPGSIDMIERV